MRTLRWLIPGLLMTFGLSRASFGESAPPTMAADQAEQVTNIGRFAVAYGPGRLQVYQTLPTRRLIWRSALDGAFLTVGAADLSIADHNGSYTLTAQTQSSCQVTFEAPVATLSGEQLTLRWQLAGDAVCLGQHVSITFIPVDADRLDFTLVPEPDGFNYITLTAASSEDESFYGFGLQPTYLDLKGQLVPLWTQEQGVTRGREPFSSLINLVSPGSAGSPVTSYMTAPYYFTNKGSGLFLKNTEYAEIDLRAAETAKLKLFAHSMRGTLLGGATPLAQVSAYTRYAGRMSALPDWLHRGAIVGMQGGTERVRQIWRELQARGTPVAAFWLQDWVGKRVTALGSQLWWNWELDAQRYPAWPDLVSDLRRQDIRLMGYINPHLVDVADQGKGDAKRNLYREAAARGYLVKDRTLGPYQVRMTTFATGMVDLTNPQARQWLKQVIKDQMIGAGLSGWMADFGEALPTDALLQSGIDARTFHNEYAVAWAQLNREAAQELGLDQEIVPFCRAGYTTSPRYGRLFWQGDQMVTWDGFDGLKSAVVGLTSGGLSGYSLNHSDIGGYATLALGSLKVLTRERELLYRWMEYSAFTSAFRTHEGNLPEANAQFYSDDDSYRMFDRNAKLFASLFFYRKQLFGEAERLGYPVVRALFLHYPDDPESYHVSDEFLLGEDILVAPVLDKASTTRTVYLPKGRWVHVWSGEVYGDDEASTHATVPSPLGEPPAFYKEGSATGATWTQELRRLGLLQD